ncbi:YciI family protein [Pseudoxanthobacter sp.]|uniref:YciI family protein n=1 Tax=Pseudoxanthobacter sp. TaxID=1925742 RepID=UPI002FE2AA33
MLFAVTCFDKPDALPARLSARPAHLEWIDANKAQIRLAGPLLDPKGENPLGSLLVVEAGDLAAAESLLAGDPYRAAGVFAEVEVRPWRMTVNTL